MSTEQLATYLAAAKAAKHLATKCGTHNVLSLGIAKIVCEDIPTLSDAVVALVAEVERLQNDLRVAEQTIADFYETGDSP